MGDRLRLIHGAETKAPQPPSRGGQRTVATVNLGRRRQQVHTSDWGCGQTILAGQTPSGALIFPAAGTPRGSAQRAMAPLSASWGIRLRAAHWDADVTAPPASGDRWGAAPAEASSSREGVSPPTVRLSGQVGDRAAQAPCPYCCSPRVLAKNDPSRSFTTRSAPDSSSAGA